MKKKVTKVDKLYDLGKLIRCAYSDMLAVIDAEFRGLGITSQQAIIIRIIDEEGSTTNMELCREMNYTKGTISGMVRRLELKGLIQRETVPQDRRQEKLSFTDEGKKFAKKNRKKIREAFDQMFSDVSDEEIEYYIEAVNNIVKELNSKLR